MVVLFCLDRPENFQPEYPNRKCAYHLLLSFSSRPSAGFDSYTRSLMVLAKSHPKFLFVIFAYIICPNRESTGFARVIGKQPGVPDGFESSPVRLTA